MRFHLGLFLLKGMGKTLINVGVFILLTFLGKGQSSLTMSAEIKNAYQEITSLKITSGQQKINQIKLKDQKQCNGLLY